MPLVLLLTKFHFEMWVFAAGIYILRNKTKVQAESGLRSALGGPECFPAGKVIESTHSDGGTGRFGGIESTPVMKGVMVRW